MKRLNQSGSHIVALALGLLAVGIIGFAGYRVSQANKADTGSDLGATVSTKAPAAIKTKADLTQAGKSLDASAQQVDTNLNDNSLNADLNGLL